MKNYVALFKQGFGGTYAPGTQVGVPESDADKALIAADLKAHPKSEIRYAASVAEAKEKLLAWVRIYRQARLGSVEFKLVNQDTGQNIDDELKG